MINHWNSIEEPSIWDTDADGDFSRCGFALKEAKAQGVFRLEGKTYVVQDSDVMHILASS